MWLGWEGAAVAAGFQLATGDVVAPPSPSGDPKAWQYPSPVSESGLAGLLLTVAPGR